jgi:hypothetical protein
MKKLRKIDKLRWFVTLTFSMSASYDFGDTPCLVCHLPTISQLQGMRGRGKKSDPFFYVH